FLHRKVPMHDEHGAIIKWFGSSIDIEDRKRNEGNLHRVVDATPALLHSARPDGYIDFLNKGWLDFVGLPIEQMIGWEWAKTFHPDDIEGLLAKGRGALASGEPFQAEGRVRRADGEYRTLLHTKAPVRDKLGKITKWYGSSIDIEDLKRAEDTLRRREAYLAQAQALSHTGSFGWNLESGELYWSDETFNILGYKKTVTPSLDLVFDRVHPEDLA